MKRRLHSAEQIVGKLREADAQLAAGSSVEQVCKQLGISDATYYIWTLPMPYDPKLHPS